MTARRRTHDKPASPVQTIPGPSAALPARLVVLVRPDGSALPTGHRRIKTRRQQPSVQQGGAQVERVVASRAEPDNLRDHRTTASQGPARSESALGNSAT